MKRLAGTRTSIACIPYLFRQALLPGAGLPPHPLTSLGSNHTTAVGLAHWRVEGRRPRGSVLGFGSSARGTWSPAFHLQGATHNCHQGATAARSVGACKWASQKGSTPHLLSPPADVVHWSLGPARGFPGPFCRPETHPSQPVIVPCTCYPTAAVLRSGSIPAPMAGPRAGAGRLRSSSSFPAPPCSRPSPRCGGLAGRLALPSAPSPLALGTWPAAVAWTSSRLSARPGAAGASREERRICMRPAAWQRRPRPRRAGRAGRGGSEAGLSSPARHGAASLLRRRSLLPPPPPSRSLVLAGAAQTCSGAAAPARIGTGLRPRDPATGASGDAPRWAGPLEAAR